MTIDLNDPKMAGYIPLEEIVEDDGGVAGGKVAEEVQLSVATLAFPDTGETYESPSQAIVITNTGYDQVTIYGVHVEGEFELKSSVPGSLLPGESASVNVSFKPISVGTKTGSVYFDTGNAAGDEYVTLSGTGIIAVADTKPNYTAAQIADKTHAVNTVGKVIGLTVFDTTNNRLMTASGSTDVAAWWNAIGTVSVVPA
ncbi:MAG: hypothetical protein EOQ44_25305 [Mesorhizobium sp.]|uniref:Ig-like domain-containing protein n=1 Tax=Mesorhizobium sp. TaxID=1871066 RepID=UPI000FE4C568|nr:hypothetical protein [Mesorhizobium sp.]RWB40459.1 MAG: hypothetical protein EOQ44_25305 [Mesorhizobium sp.]